jgi:hypothetical protein
MLAAAFRLVTRFPSATSDTEQGPKTPADDCVSFRQWTIVVGGLVYDV